MKRFNLLASALTLIGVAISVSSVGATTLRVPIEYPTMNAALDASAFGDTVLVAPGTYTDVETRGNTTSMAFLKDGVYLLSEAGSAATILEMSHPVPGSQRPLVMVGTGLSSGLTVVEGFTMLAGGHDVERGIQLEFGTSGFTVRDCVFDGFNARPFPGGAIQHFGGPATLAIHTCVMRNCQAGSGGAIRFGVNMDLIITDSLFENNEADWGAAIGVNGDPHDPVVGNARLERCTFVGNRSGSLGGGTFASSLALESVEILDCVFLDNESESSGGAVSVALAPTATARVERCVFARNRATGPGSIGGAMVLSNENTWVIDCTFYGNSAISDAGTLVVARTLATLRRNVFVSSSGGTAVLGFLSGVTHDCNVFWDNPGGNVSGFTLSATDREVDPLFCGADLGDFTVGSSSPCLPPNSLGCGQIGALGQGCGAVSVQPVGWATIKSLYRSE